MSPSIIALIVSGVLVVALAFVSIHLFRKLSLLESVRERYSGVIDLEAEERKLERENEKTRRTIQQLYVDVGRLKAQTEELEEESYLQDFGFYKPRYDFESSLRYKAELDRIRGEQKALIKNKRAAVCHTEWTVEGSKRKGQQMTNNNLKLMLRAFNGESDAAIAKVKYNNIEAMEKRLIKSSEAINKLSKQNNSEITQRYLNLKLKELFLVHEYQEQKQQEKEEQKRIKEQMREEQKALKEIEKAQKAAEKEEQQYQQALERARREMQKAQGAKQEALNDKIRELEMQLAEAAVRKERAISQAQLTRSGHVYIISNLGSFGENIYKIGMTRRLEPSERIRELSSASVPFPFDVHAMIYSTDAPGLENSLHKAFDNFRLNRVNQRKEFFHVTLDEIERVVRRDFGSEVEFTRLSEAREYRETLALQKNNDTASNTEVMELSEFDFATLQQ